MEPTAAAQKLHIDPESPLYEESLKRLQEWGYLEQTYNPALGTTMGAYRLTEEGLAKAKELRSV